MHLIANSAPKHWTLMKRRHLVPSTTAAKESPPAVELIDAIFDILEGGDTIEMSQEPQKGPEKSFLLQCKYVPEFMSQISEGFLQNNGQWQTNHCCSEFSEECISSKRGFLPSVPVGGRQLDRTEQFFVLFYFGFTHTWQSVLRANTWHCYQGSLLTDLTDSMGCQE